MVGLRDSASLSQNANNKTMKERIVKRSLLPALKLNVHSSVNLVSPLDILRYVDYCI